ncbi:hypothetical protein CKO32_16625 [Afifella marina DSM 2698]|nr:hypothetical protein [Afifella marina DSM 2698]MBK1628902.1 hypothetical protein [Afifella marina]MBK5918281.1 hypothetical protein [Afifella marina]RAI22802.1 hypothetical protein CH311_03885 [Afifella marina DSM 2698]
MFFMPIDRSYATEVGNVIVQWSFLDQGFHNLIEAAYNVTNTAQEENWRRLRPKQKRKLLAGLAEEAFLEFPRIKAAISRILDELADLSIDRNLLAHGEIAQTFPAQPGPIRLTVWGRYNGKDYVREYDVSHLRSIVTRLAETHGDARMLMPDDLAEDYYPGWSPDEISALRGFRPNNLSSRAASSRS